MLRNTDIGKQKQFIKGLHQLEAEGAMQVLYDVEARQRDPILAAVGQLQFDVVRARLEAEYNVATILELLPYRLSRWVDGPAEEIERLPWGHGLLKTRDADERWVALFKSQFDLKYCEDKYPAVTFAMFG